MSRPRMRCDRCGCYALEDESGMCVSCRSLFAVADADREWMTDALCTQVDPELFFPATGVNPRVAVRVCAACPVRVECLDYALRFPVLDGVWGGTTRGERRQLRGSSGEVAA